MRMVPLSEVLCKMIEGKAPRSLASGVRRRVVRLVSACCCSQKVTRIMNQFTLRLSSFVRAYACVSHDLYACIALIGRLGVFGIGLVRWC